MIQGNSRTVSNWYPFGGGSGGWNPYMGFIYKNIPQFSLKAGDIIAFDLGAPNDVDINLSISLATASYNGALTTDAYGFTEVVTQQTPSSPRGDNIMGNYELQFTVHTGFNFAGGGLIVRFSNPGGAFASDSSGDQVSVVSTSSDSSGYFVARFYRDADGLSPFDTIGTTDIGNVKFILSDAIVPEAQTLFFIFLGLMGFIKLRK